MFIGSHAMIHKEVFAHMIHHLDILTLTITIAEDKEVLYRFGISCVA
jgi:hypothetical protein